MCRIISIANQKGGVGKTATSINLSYALAAFPRKVLLIDMDPQGNVSLGLGIQPSNSSFSILDVLLFDADIHKAIKPTLIKTLDIIPSKLQLADFESLIFEKGIISPYTLLKDSLKDIVNDYDYIIIDCPPSLGFLTKNALTASSSVIIPVQCEYFALEAIGQMLASISNVKNNYNNSLTIEGFLITMFDAKNNMSIEISEQIRHLFRENTFISQIPRSNSIADSNMKGIPLTAYRPTGSASLAYFSLAREVIDNEKTIKS